MLQINNYFLNCTLILILQNNGDCRMLYVYTSSENSVLVTILSDGIRFNVNDNRKEKSAFFIEYWID